VVFELIDVRVRRDDPSRLLRKRAGRRHVGRSRAEDAGRAVAVDAIEPIVSEWTSVSLLSAAVAAGAGWFAWGAGG
jgi:hypothetical protein